MKRVFLALLFFSFTAQAKQKYCSYEPEQNAWPAPAKIQTDKNLDWGSLNPDQGYAYKLYAKLTGVTPDLNNPKFIRIVKLIQQNKIAEGVQMILKDDNFYQVRMRNFAAPFSSKDYSTFENFNDLQALIIGITRDDLDARLILSGDIRYSASEKAGLPAVSMGDNEHYLAFDAANMSYVRDLKKFNKQWDGFEGAAGALTTRAWAKIGYDMGTNRRNVPNSFNVFLCAPIEGWKARGIPDLYVRRDVPRNTSEDPNIYQNVCRNCHGLMDGMGGAFAKFDFVQGVMMYSKDEVMPKMYQNGHVYPQGYVPTDDSWDNLMNYNPAVDFGWRTSMKGQGIKAFGEMLANSKAFTKCLVTKMFQEVCGKPILSAAPELLEPLASRFEEGGYKIKTLVSNIAMEQKCISPEGALE
jgi:hypothetical protein